MTMPSSFNNLGLHYLNRAMLPIWYGVFKYKCSALVHFRSPCKWWVAWESTGSEATYWDVNLVRNFVAFFFFSGVTRQSGQETTGWRDPHDG
jgi:hypothetical protein